MLSRTAVFLLLALSPLAAFADNDCAFRAERTLDIDVKGVDTFKLDTGAGDLDVKGVPGLARIEIRGKACASDQDRLAALQLTQRRDGNTAFAATQIPDSDGGVNPFGSRYAYIDVEVRMPAELALQLRDSSGDIEIAGLRKGIDLTDSSGDIELRDVAGAVRISDTSGDIEVDGAEGDVTIDADSSGDIDLRNVRGDAYVRNDSSGDVKFRRVSGRARIDNDSSGDIVFDDIGGDASVGHDSSGDIRADHVRGGFTVESKANVDDIHYANVGGKVSLPPRR
ncbi:DUF4097 family beta strand repeat-containing protein [Dokdonella sp.]|uniref:DUF4097 family beta strand repeat-containing protein n=1 Tax=Dokdonella sp. TaxID=2291710 RepID=UPI001B06C484|nr:DUF4097 family beta strand repeat-containing protein [Dokdonella sp.]MBO9663865.1 DUF4097 family beta strand repeat protein [Dokdonella sp.]